MPRYTPVEYRFTASFARLCLRALCAVCWIIIAVPALGQRSTPVQLLHPAGAASDNFGLTVAVDGDTMIVGAPFDDDQGSAHVYRWTGTGWAFEATLTAPDGAAGDNFGYSVALSGDTALVGAFNHDVGSNTAQGSAYVFVRPPGTTTWTQQAQLTATGGAAFDNFGISVSISCDTAAVGALGNSGHGSAYVFVRSPGGPTWTQQAQLTASDGAPGDFFGIRVSLSGDTAVVGSPLDDVGGRFDQGSAYVFVRPAGGTTWMQQAQLTASNGAARDRFGISVSLSGDTAMVGAAEDDVGANADQGSVYVFLRSGAIWTQQAQLTASDGAPGDGFGSSISLSGDTAVVGAAEDDVGANTDSGSAYVFLRSPGGTTWTQQAQLTAPDGAAFDFFGSSVSISGDTALVGVPNDRVGADNAQGSAWVFSRIGSTWIGPDLTLLASDGAASDFFGTSVSLSGDTAVVGAPVDRVGANQFQGSAYVFVRPPGGTTWTQQAQLTASDGAAGDSFGHSVSLSGDTAVVGAHADDVGASPNQGSAYVFVRPPGGTTWTQQARLTASDGAAGDSFGYSVSLSGDTAVVGVPNDRVEANNAQGSAYVFVRSPGGTTWTQQARLTASDGAAGDSFGYSVSLSGDTAVVGAHTDDVGANTDQGSAYVFVRAPDTTWTQQAQLTAPDGAAFDFFGSSVSLSGDAAVVGAHGAVVGAGSACIFVRSPGDTTWTQQAKLTASDGAAGDGFGSSVSLSGDTAVVGASNHDVGANTAQGSAYVFVRSPGGTTWTQRARLTASDGAAFDFFGSSVSISGNTAVVGASGDDVGANNDQGSAYVFEVPYNRFTFVRNESLDANFPTLAAALASAVSGHAITATSPAFAEMTSLDTLGRSLDLNCTGDLRTPSTAPITLGGSSALSTPAGDSTDIFGDLRVPASQLSVISTDHFRQGSRGQLRLSTNAQLIVDALEARLEGPALLDARATLDLRGDAHVCGDLTASPYSSVSALGSLTNFGAWSLAGGSIGATLFTNRASLDVLGTSGIFGDFSNESGAVTTITSARLFVVGTLTNNGTIVGDVCPGCSGASPGLDADGDLILGPAAGLTMPFSDALVHVGGDFDCAINSNARYDMALATLQLQGSGGAEQSLEVMSRDIGPDPLGLDRTLAGHYPIGVLRIGPAASIVRLVDARDNDGLGQGACEAIYVGTLRIDAGSRLINTTCRVYYSTLVNNGVVDVPGNLVPIPPPCPCDWNLDTAINSQDFFDFLSSFFGGAADFNHDSLTNSQDFFDFLACFFAGC